LPGIIIALQFALVRVAWARQSAVMYGNLGKHLHESGAEGEDGFDMEVGAAAGIKEDGEL